jgi:hypothetical protein
MLLQVMYTGQSASGHCHCANDGSSAGINVPSACSKDTAQRSHGSRRASVTCHRACESSYETSKQQKQHQGTCAVQEHSVLPAWYPVHIHPQNIMRLLSGPEPTGAWFQTAPQVLHTLQAAQAMHDPPTPLPACSAAKVRCLEFCVSTATIGQLRGAEFPCQRTEHSMLDRRPSMDTRQHTSSYAVTKPKEHLCKVTGSFEHIWRPCSSAS